MTTRNSDLDQIITVIKLDHLGRPSYLYNGRLIEKRDHLFILEAFFDREDTPVEELVLRKGDRFVEFYFDDRWYNVFEIHDRLDDPIKGWYCNIGYPAEFQQNTISYRDLALDLLIYPDGRQIILDQNEFAALHLPDEVQSRAKSALAEVQQIFSTVPKNLVGTGSDNLNQTFFS